MTQTANSFHFPRAWQAIGWLIVLAVIVLSLIKPPELHVDIDNGDKYGHVLAYFAAMFWQLMRMPAWRGKLFWTVGLIGLGIAMEFAQGHLTTTRSMDWQDGIADALGVVLAWIVSRTAMVNLLVRLDHWLWSRWRAR